MCVDVCVCVCRQLLPKISVRSGTRKPPSTNPTSTIDSSVCPKCGYTSKSGKRSCCARGGAWFKNCGDDDGDMHFDHTWSEGILACNSLASSVSVKSELIMIRNTANQHSTIDHTYDISRAAIMVSEYYCCLGVVEVVVYIFVLFS